MSKRTQRRLAAIVSADVVGYSRLMQADESGTYARLKARYQTLVLPGIEIHGGRVVKLMGDGLLAEFPSVVSAATWAIEVQGEIETENRNEPPESRIDYRIGINLGDVIIDGDDLYGDGVNLAARLQEVAEPGGICLSNDAFRQVRGKVSEDFVDGGEVAVKNIAEPVQVWRWSPGNVRAGSTSASPVDGSLALPDKPSIAVLPFENMSGDPEQTYFADGLSEDIITGLSCIRSLFVIARNSSFVYRGSSIDVNRVSQELGIRYVLEGSVRRSGKRIRVTGQLIDASNRNHIWAQRFDRNLDDIFDVQDEITNAIVAAIGAEVDSAERARALRRPTDQLDAWSFYQRGLWHLYHWNEENIPKAILFFTQALSHYPNLALAHSGLSHAHYINALLGLSDKYDIEAQKALEHARKAVALDEKDPMSYWSLGRAHRILGDVEQAIPCFRTALELNPNFAQAHYNLGWSLVLSGQIDADAIDHLDQALRLSPRDPLMHTFLMVRGIAALISGDPREALRWAESAVQQPNLHVHGRAAYIAILELNGRHEAAVKATQDLLSERPDYCCSLYRRVFPFKISEAIEVQISSMRAAGMPE